MLGYLIFTLDSGVAAQTAIEQEIQVNIKWLYNSTNAPTSIMGSYFFQVPIGGGLTSVRGPLSGRECLYYATIFALQSDVKKANAWLQAGQSHNESVMQLFADNAYYCASYIKQEYAQQAVAFFGGNYVSKGSLGYLSPILRTIKKHDPPRPMPIPPTDRKQQHPGGAEGREPCKKC